MNTNDSRQILIETIAVDLGYVSDRQIQECMKEHQRTINPQGIGQLLMRKGLITRRQLNRILKEQTIRVMEFSQKLRSERKQVKQELSLAREVQRRLIPKDIWVPSGLDVAHFYRPAGEVGGDFYDAGRFSENGFWVALGDVAGKGIPAAMVTGMVFTLLRLTSVESNSPAEILQQLNVMLHQQLRKGTFVTMQYLQVDTSKRSARLASAGHNPVFVVPAKGKALEVSGEGAALGILDPNNFYSSVREILLDLNGLRRLLLYTDGLLEAMNPKEPHEGKDVILSILEETRKKTCAEVVHRLAQEVARREKGQPRDDIALIAVGFP